MIVVVCFKSYSRSYLQRLVYTRYSHKFNIHAPPKYWPILFSVDLLWGWLTQLPRSPFIAFDWILGLYGYSCVFMCSTHLQKPTDKWLGYAPCTELPRQCCKRESLGLKSTCGLVQDASWGYLCCITQM